MGNSYAHWLADAGPGLLSGRWAGCGLGWVFGNWCVGQQRETSQPTFVATVCLLLASQDYCRFLRTKIHLRTRLYAKAKRLKTSNRHHIIGCAKMPENVQQLLYLIAFDIPFASVSSRSSQIKYVVGLRDRVAIMLVWIGCRRSLTEAALWYRNWQQRM